MPSSADTRAAAIVVGAGRGARFGAADKVLATVNGRPVIAYAIDAAQASGCVNEIVVVVGDHILMEMRALASSHSWSKLTSIVVGGIRRQDSVAAGMRALSSAVTLVAVHDAARPLATPDLFDRSIDSLREYDAAICAVPVTDTLKRVHDRRIVETIARNGIWAAQTPQSFRRSLLVQALTYAEDQGIDVTDEAALFERLGYRVAVVDGSPDNIKITVPGDVRIASALLANRVG